MVVCVMLSSTPPAQAKIEPRLRYRQSAIITRSNKEYLDATCAWSVLILSKVKQQLPELLLASSTGTSLDALSAEINKLRNALPAGTSGAGVLPVGQKLFSLAAGLGDRLLLLGVVVLVEIVDILLGSLDCLLLLLLRLPLSVLQGKISALTPFTDNFWLRLVVLWTIGRWVRAGDGSAWSNIL